MRLIVIVSDTFRYDHLGANGNAWIRTPELDAFAAQATALDNCYVSSFPTIPTRTDWFTGTLGFPHYGWRPLEPTIPVLSESLRGAGYVNQLIVDCPHVLRDTAFFNRGFHGYTWIRGQEGDTPLTWMNHELEEITPDEKTRPTPRPFGANLTNKHAWQNRWWDSQEDHFVARTCRTACHWLEHNYKAEKFLLWVECFDAHEPWDPPEYLWRRYDPDYHGPPMRHPNYGKASAYTKAELRNMRAHYAGECTMVSKHIGRLLRMVEEVGIWDDTIIAFLTDHGMYLGEHNRCGKSNLHPDDHRGSWPLYQEVAHIPLLIHVPGTKPGRRLKHLFHGPDLMPTLLELLGIPAPDTVNGYSLARALRGEKQQWPRKVLLSSPALGGSGKTASRTTVTDGRWTLICTFGGGARPELYDLRADPQQKQNVFDDHPTVARRLHRAMVSELRRVGTSDEKLAAMSEL